MKSSFEVLAKGISMVGESPTWSADKQTLYWVDITERKVNLWSELLGIQSWKHDQMTASIMQYEPNNLILFQENRVSALEFSDQEMLTTHLTQIIHPYTNLRFNDGTVDRQGRAWISSMRMTNNGDKIGSLYCYHNNQFHAHLHGLATPNGMAFSPDGRTMYLSDSHPTVQKIWAFDFDIIAGELSNRRIFLDMQHYAGRPDGATVDTDGCYWICAIDSGSILRFSPQGQLLTRYDLPISKPSKCTFGGKDMKTLFVTSIKPQHPNELDGSLLAIQTPYQGIVESKVKPDAID